MRHNILAKEAAKLIRPGTVKQVQFHFSSDGSTGWLRVPKVEVLGPLPPSATPHLDVAKTLIEQMKVKKAPLMRRPGRAGVEARGQTLIMEAYALAIATERERGSEEKHIYVAVAAAIADMVASQVASMLHRSGHTTAEATVEGVGAHLETISERAFPAALEAVLGTGRTADITAVSYPMPAKGGTA